MFSSAKRALASSKLGWITKPTLVASLAKGAAFAMPMAALVGVGMRMGVNLGGYNPSGQTEPATWSTVRDMAIYGVGIAPAVEEAVFRKVPSFLTDKITGDRFRQKAVWAVGVPVSLAFGWVHNPELVAGFPVVQTILGGYLWAQMRKGGYLNSTATHLGYNAAVTGIVAAGVAMS